MKHKDLTFSSGRCFVVAEVAQAHDGSLGTAHAYIDAIAAAGADAVKFQTHIANAESMKSEPWRVKFSPQDETRFDYWKRMEFTPEQWAGLKEHADKVGLTFLSSAFSIEAIRLLQALDMPAWKIASGEVSNPPFFEEILRTGRPVLLSTGMSPIAETDRAVEMILSRGVPLTVMQCTSIYPTPPEKVGLNMLPVFRERYGCPVGLSDHSGSIYAGLAAVTMGIEVLEVHAVFSRETFGPDVSASITTPELKQLVDGIRMIESMREHPVDKDQVASDLAAMRRLFNKSLVATRDLSVGVVISSEDLACKKPGSGIPASQISQVIGRKVRRRIRSDEFVMEDDIE